MFFKKLFRNRYFHCAFVLFLFSLVNLGYCWMKYGREKSKKYFYVECDEHVPEFYFKEGVHHPNQNLYNHILSKKPKDWVRLSPPIPENVQLIIVSTSIPKAREDRDRIRRTSANVQNGYIQNGTVSFVFLVGDDEETVREMLKEQKVHQDMLIMKIRESYRGMVYKLLMAFQYLSWRYPKATVAKIDKDVVLDIDRLMTYLNRELGRKPLLLGAVAEGVTPERNETSRWYVSPQVYSPPFFPDYLHGKLYIMSHGALAALMRVSRGATVFEVEDTFFTGLLRQRANLRIAAIDLFIVGAEKFPGCDYEKANEMIAVAICGNVEERYHQWMAFRQMNLCSYVNTQY